MTDSPPILTPKRTKLALHWKILIGLALGVAVGLAINLGWTAKTWSSMGVGNAGSYLAHKHNGLAAPTPTELQRVGELIRSTGPERGVLGTDLSTDEDARESAIQAIAWMIQGFRPIDPGLFSPPTAEWVESSRAWMLKELDRMESAGWAAGSARFRPEQGVDQSSQQHFVRNWIVADPELQSALNQITDPNAKAGAVAATARFAREANLFIGAVFLKLLKFIAVPLVLFSLIVGTASLNDTAKLGRIGGKTIGIYLATTAVAITVGLVLANVVGPGRGFPEDVREKLLADGSASASEKMLAAENKPGMWDVLLDAVPSNPFQAMAETEMLQVVFAALLFGVAMTMLPREKSAPVIAFCDGLTEAVIKIVHIVMAIAPYAVFALIVKVVAELGLNVLESLIKYSLVVLAGLAVMMLGVYPLLLRLFTPVGFRRFFRAMSPAQLLAFSSSSSGPTLPVTMECCEERLGVKEEVSSFVLPLGATINMDGTALWQGVTAVFIAQLYGIDLTLGAQLTIVITATLASIGTAAVPSAGIIMLVIVLQATGLPMEGIAVIFGVDRILDMCRTSCNVTGDAMVAAVVAHTEGQLLTEEQLARLASGETLDEFTTTDEAREKAYE